MANARFKDGDYVNFSIPVAGQPHIGAGRILRVEEVPGGQLLLMGMDGRGFKLVLDTTDPEHRVFHAAPPDAGIDAKLLPTSIEKDGVRFELRVDGSDSDNVHYTRCF